MPLIRWRWSEALRNFKYEEAIAKLPATGKPPFCRPLHLFRLAFSPEMSIAGTERAGKPALANEVKIIDFPGRGSFATASENLSLETGAAIAAWLLDLRMR